MGIQNFQICFTIVLCDLCRVILTKKETHHPLSPIVSKMHYIYGRDGKKILNRQKKNDLNKHQNTVFTID